MVDQSPLKVKKQALTSTTNSDFMLEALKQIAPSAFTEVRGTDGELTHKVDFKALRELLGDAILDADEECFGFHWVGKQDAKRAAAKPTRQTLRPVVEDSVDWDTTENLYIEGDNLEVLKLLQRGYLGKVKMIYIDPPYNTGNDFVYNDNFAMTQEQLDEAMDNLDEYGNRLRKNLDSNPRYHSDWCSMIYSRLFVARTLLANDGVIFISIDDNEVHHLRIICDEVFGAGNFLGTITRKQSSGSKNDSGYDKVISTADYLLVFQKGNFTFKPILVKNKKSFSFTDEQGKFSIRALEMQGGGDTLPQRPKMGYSIYYKKDTNEVKLLFDYDLGNTPVYELPNSNLLAQGYKCYRPRPRGSGDMALGRWRWGDGTFKERFAEGGVYFDEDRVYMKERASDNIEKYPEAILDQYLNTTGTNELKVLFKDRVFSFPKPVSLIEYLLRVATSPESFILDFFSGSATTAHAVMQLNAEDGGKRKYICVQVPEETPEDSEARKAGYNTICEIGKERIRRAGKKIKDENKDKNIDTGFRVLRIDSSNMEDIYFEPINLKQDDLFKQVDSIKEGRTELDLLFGCMVDWGVELSNPLRTEEIAGKQLHIVNEGALVACFNKDITLEVIQHIAKMNPQRVIFRESCFEKDADKLNIYEQFKQLCGWNNDESYKRIHVI